MSLGNEYSGANVDFINDSTQDALNLKANLDGGNVFTGGAGELNRFNTNVFIDPAQLLQAKNIWGYEGLSLNTSAGYNLNLNPTGKVTSTGSIDLVAGKEYLIDGVNILDAKANLAGGNTFTGEQIVSDIIVGGDIKGVNNQDLNIASITNGVEITSVTIKPTGDTEMDGDTTFKQSIIGGVSQSLISGVRVIDSTRLITKLDTRAGNITATISNGIADGQIKIINLHRADATQYTATLLTNVSEPITLKNVGEGVILAWSANTADWSVVAKNVSFLNNDLSVDGDINLTAGKQYLIDGVASVGITPAQATQIETNTTDIASKANDSDVVKLSGNQIIGGEKTFTNDTYVNSDIYLADDDGKLILGTNYDRKIYRTADGIRTDDTMDASQYKIAGTRIASTDLGDNNTLVKTSGIQSISDVKTFSDDVKFEGDLLIRTNTGEIKFGEGDDRTIARTADGISTNGTMSATQYNINGTDILSPYRTSAATDTLLDAKANLTANTFTERQTITKAHNYSQLHLIDSSTAGAGKGGGIEFLGVFNGSGATTAFATIKSQKANATIGNYEANLSLQLREHGGGGYTEVVGLKGADLSAHFSGAVNISGALNITYSSIPLGTGVGNASPPVAALSGDIYRSNDNSLKITP